MNSRGLNFKTCLLGSQGVGKTSIVCRIGSDIFKKNVSPTVGASFSSVVLTVDNHPVRFQIWDTAGQERFRSMIPMYYRKTNAAIVVFDITSMESFKEVIMWVEELKRSLDNEFVLCVVGNKSDLVTKRMVDREKATKFAYSLGALYFETSAKTSDGIMDAFIHTARQLINSQCHGQNDAKMLLNQQPEKLEIDSGKATKKSFCCF